MIDRARGPAAYAVLFSSIDFPMQHSTASRPLLRGLALAGLAYALFAAQDALVKWLVASYAVPQILFTRSIVIIALAFLIGGPKSMRSLAASPNKAALFARAGLILAAWLTYYTAARSLGLAELTTLYFAAPIIIVVLAVVILKEKVGPARWAAVLAGFAGVAIAAGPASLGSMTSVVLVLIAATCWAFSMILVRLISRSEKTTNQMLISNAIFAGACLFALPFIWRTPDLEGIGLMLALGFAGGLGQYFLFESFNHAPASAIAPIEYTALVWAFLFGYLVWGDVPQREVFIGASMIVGSCLALLWSEGRWHKGR